MKTPKNQTKIIQYLGREQAAVMNGKVGERNLTNNYAKKKENF